MSKKITFEVVQLFVLVVAFIASVGYAAHWKYIDSSTPTPVVVRPLFTVEEAKTVLCGEGLGAEAMRCGHSVVAATTDVSFRYLYLGNHYSLTRISESMKWLDSHAR